MAEPNPSPPPWNPLLEEFLASGGDPGPQGETRSRLIARYAFGIPDEEALAAICDAAPPAGIVEIGAGLGYWARLFADRGVDVVAYDLHPPPSLRNQNFPGTEPWHPVLEGDELAVDHHGDRLLLFVWPTADEDWPAEALTRFHRAGGAVVAYVGGERGGVTGDDRFHRLLGSEQACLACNYGVTTTPCVCHIDPLWELTWQRPLPAWGDDGEALRLYRRRTRETRPRTLRSRWSAR